MNKFDQWLKRCQKFYHEYDRLPTYAEATYFFWAGSKSSINTFFVEGQKLGFWEKSGRNWNLKDKFFEMDVYDNVKAGPTTIQRDFEKSVIRLEKYMIKDPTRNFIMRVKWDSMKDMSILEWDMVIIDPDAKPILWDTIIATHMDHGTMIKIFAKSNWKYVLRSANEKYDDIEIQDTTTIDWVVTWVIRKL